jgi:poly-gamma-glutamate capsule biosynthesis protein CapA/YwtB (metallophosphatase superfamily)
VSTDPSLDRGYAHAVTLTIGLLGDVMLGRGVAGRLETVPPEDVWAPELREVAAGCDLVIGNLECCISDRGSPTELVASKPFFFRAPPIAVDCLRAMGVGAVGLANNHALDFGPHALADTLRHLHSAGIAFSGAGFGPEQARRGVELEVAGSRIGLVAVSDHPREYAAAPGAWGIAHAPLREGTPDWVLEEVRGLRERCELVVCFPHWGPNMTSAPAPWQRRLAADLVEAGADLVAGHSAHVFHGAGSVEGRPVLFDLGDALDDYAVDADMRNDLGLMALWRPDGEPRIELVGLELEHCRTRLAAGREADWIALRLERACPPLGTSVRRLSEQRFSITLPWSA